MFTPRVIGTAVARYNFAARDLRELSLRDGDVVKIYSRIGGDQGWWKGETNGRVSGSAWPPVPVGDPSSPWGLGRQGSGQHQAPPCPNPVLSDLDRKTWCPRAPRAGVTL